MRSRATGWAGLFVAITLVVAGTNFASAQGTGGDGGDALDRARVHYDKAETLFASGQFAAAVSEYQAAYGAAPLPDFLFNIGQCYRNLGRWDEAIFSFKKYLEHKPDAADRADVEVTIAELERERDRESAARMGIAGAAPLAPGKPRPIYRRWWFIAGAVGLVTATTVAAIYLSRDELPVSDLGPLDFSR